MLSQRQDPLVGLLIRRRADRSEPAEASLANAMLCPACARSMTRVRTIWRASQDDLQVFECRACSVSVSAKMSPRPS